MVTRNYNKSETKWIKTCHPLVSSMHTSNEVDFQDSRNSKRATGRTNSFKKAAKVNNKNHPKS